MTSRKAVLLVSALAVLSTACKKGETAEATPADSAPALTLGATDVGTARAQTIRAGVPMSGPLSPKVTVTLGAPVAEQIAEMFVNEGDAVRQGQPVARFRDDVLRAAAASATADLASARTSVTLAAAESTRAVALFAEGAIAQRDRDNAVLALETTRSRFALAQSQSAAASDRLATATLRSTESGVVSKRHVQAGDRVDLGKPVLEIVNTSVLELAASVEARWIGDLRVGQPVVLSVTGLERDTIEGRIARINPIADPSTRQVKVYVEVPNSRGRLVGGLYVSGHAVTREVPNAVAVPKAAVRIEGTSQETVVYVVASGRLSRRVVQLGVEDASLGLVQVTGVNDGESVIVGPVEGLSDGLRVDVGGRS